MELYIDPVALAAARDRANMTAIEFRHSLTDFLARQSREDLDLLQKLLVYVDDDKGTCGFMQGLISAERTHRFKICGACGTDHEEDFQKLMGQPGEPVQSDADVLREHIAEQKPLADDGSETAAREVEQAEDGLMELYGIQRSDSGREPWTPFRCKGCGIGVASLEDRMLKDPGMDGCSGCQQKSRWG